MQKAFTFDSKTLRNIARGAVHATMVAALLGLLDFVAKQAGMVQSNNAIVSMALAWFAQNGYQIVRQYIKGA